MQSWILWTFSCKIKGGHMKLHRKLHFVHLKLVEGDVFFPIHADKKQSNTMTKK